MKPWTIALAATLVAVSIPLVTAEAACSRAGITEAVAHPTKAQTYIFFDITQPEKVGEWVEWNKSPGLQTVNCVSASGSIRWGPDHQMNVLG
ncbi:MAG TPA: hypothetical protein VFH78_15325 [Candidatus Thermoplasmatota archaeon]|nr:hypothetical protein [Candidatus Thermoplasmatota archaeon]